MMIEQSILDSVKLVDQNNLASVSMTESAISRAVTQGSQAWGVTTDDAVILRLTDELRVAAELATKYDDTYKQLKGVQMENGRLRVALDKKSGADEALSKSEFRVRELEATVARLHDQLRVAKLHIQNIDKTEETC